MTSNTWPYITSHIHMVYLIRNSNENCRSRWPWENGDHVYNVSNMEYIVINPHHIHTDRDLCKWMNVMNVSWNACNSPAYSCWFVGSQNMVNEIRPPNECHSVCLSVHLLVCWSVGLVLTKLLTTCWMPSSNYLKSYAYLTVVPMLNTVIPLPNHHIYFTYTPIRIVN